MNSTEADNLPVALNRFTIGLRTVPIAGLGCLLARRFAWIFEPWLFSAHAEQSGTTFSHAISLMFDGSTTAILIIALLGEPAVIYLAYRYRKSAFGPRRVFLDVLLGLVLYVAAFFLIRPV